MKRNHSITLSSALLTALTLSGCGAAPEYSTPVDDDLGANSLVVEEPISKNGGTEEGGSQTGVVPCKNDISCYEADVLVDPKYNPYLSGMPFGTISQANNGTIEDVASPDRIVIVRSHIIVPGASLKFAVSGITGNNPTIEHPIYANADGDLSSIFKRAVNGVELLVENNISTLRAPANSMIGVFLSDALPTDSAAPTIVDQNCPRDFSLAMDRNRALYAPALKQTFFIGDGVNDAGDTQTFKIPVGATRLYLANQDQYEWNNNSGQFHVHVTSTLPH